MSSTARDIRQQPFYWIERDFLPTYGAQIGPLGIAVYNALVYRSDRAGRAFPGLSDLACLTGIRSRTTLRRVLATLEEANLIKINQRFTGVKYETNEYFILPVGHEVTQGGSVDGLGVGQQMTQVGQQMTQVGQQMTEGGSADDQYLHAINNNHEQQSLTTSSSSMLPAAAAAILEKHDIDPSKQNGQAMNLAAWLVYAMTQPGLKNPVGYAMTRIRRNEEASDVFKEIVNIEIEWDNLPKCAHYEARARLGYMGMPNYEELETVSDDALKVLEELHEALQ